MPRAPRLVTVQWSHNAKFKIKGKKAKRVEKKLCSYFEEHEREVAIAEAIQDGYF